LDSLALRTDEEIIASLVVEEAAVILDLMAGWDSHIPESIRPSKVVGLGLNERELESNPRLSEYIIHDINKDPRLPFEDASFDVVLNTVSIDYMTKPVEIFREVGRILRPGGLFLVIFSNRMFPSKAIRIWKESSEDERIILVEDFFKASMSFEKPTVFVSIGKPRPKEDKYSAYLKTSDPIYAVYANRITESGISIKRPKISLSIYNYPSEEETQKRMHQINDALECPYCGQRMKKWKVPDNPFCQTWENDHMFICFNDLCPYYVRGWDVMYAQTFQTMSYRCMYNPKNQKLSPIPVPSPYALKEGIVED
jgi:SAM-dependent methyltransferase